MITIDTFVIYYSKEVDESANTTRVGVIYEPFVFIVINVSISETNLKTCRSNIKC